MKELRRILMLLMVAVMLIGIAACGADEGGGTDSPSPGGVSDDGSTGDGDGDGDGDSSATSNESRHLGGIEIKIGDWWTANDAPAMSPKNLRDEQMEDLRYYLEEEHGFTVRNWGVSGWGDYLEIFTTSVMAGEPEADIWVMSTTWAFQLMSQGLLYPLNTLDSIDLSEDKWNHSVINSFTDGDGNVYALTNARFVEPRNFLFYNKRLFQEAGIDPEEPYDLQASGQWTWDKFMEYSEKLTQDKDGDGIPDTYAFTGFWGPTQQSFITSNNARHIGVNDDGSFYNAMLEPNFAEAMQFLQDYYDAGHFTLGPEDAEWDWFNTGFADGHAAMCIPIGAYQSETWLSMADDWGMLFPPKGPRADDYCTIFEENVFVLPFNIGKEKAEDIMYAYNLYTQPLPYDIENPEYWKDGAWGYQRYKDARAVDETLTMFYEGRMELNSKVLIDPGSNWWGETYDWGALQDQDASVMEKIESARPVIDARINEVNSR